MYRFLFFIMTVLFFIACEKDKPIVSEPVNVSTGFNNGLFFVNEGQFNQANASLSYYDVENDSLVSQAYETVNNQRIGDILQSIAFDEENIYLVVNNSGKIIVADKKTLVQKGEITDLPSPRYMEYSGNGDLWYVSNLFNDSLFVVNTSNYTIESKEYMDASVEAMKTVNGKLYMSSSSINRLIVKDLNSDAVDSLNVSLGGNSLALDKNDNLWLLCSGDYYVPGSAALYKINTNSLDLNQHVLEPEINIAAGYPTKLTYDIENNTLYFLNTDVYALNLDESTAEPKIFIAANGKSFYGLNIIDDSVFVSDAIDFTQNGLVYEYSLNGELLNTLTAGINPNAIVATP